MPQVNTPHEFLVRWDDAGALKGAHLVYRQSFQTDAGVEEFSKFGDPVPVALTDSTLLSTISADINTAALADGVLKTAQIDQMTADHATALNQAAADLATATGERDAALAEAQALMAQLAAFQPSVNAAGVPAWVDAVQGEKQLIIDGKMARVQEVLAAMAGTDGELARVDFARAPRWHRDSYMVAAMVAAGIYTEAEVDAAFIRAATL